MLNVTDSMKNKILAARKEIPADLVLRGGMVVNLFIDEIQKKDVAIFDGTIVGIGSGYFGKDEIDLDGRYVIPGLIDGHFHIESTMLIPHHLAPALLVHGTTTIVADPHEIANVMGIYGIQFMLKDSRSLPFDIFFMAPSCVPATTLETSGATLNSEDLMVLKDEPRILGLAEMMNYPGVLAADTHVLEKISLFEKKIVDGHCPGLTGPELQAYITAGIRSDHETVEQEEGLEKIEKGMMLMIREGTSAKNLEKLLPLVNYKTAGRVCIVSDDLHPEDIAERGHLDFILKKVVGMGVDPITAVRMVTLNTATYFGLKDRGAIAPGYRADLVVMDNLENFKVGPVFKNGKMVVRPGDSTADIPKTDMELNCIGRGQPLNIAPMDLDSFRIKHPGGKARVIELVPGQITTTLDYKEIKAVDGYVKSDIESDILKLCVVERHNGSGRIGLGLVRGFGLNQGAIASSVAHDSHNVIVVGVSDEDIFMAVDAVRAMGGGLAAVCNGITLEKVPLEIAGLMSSKPLESLVDELGSLKRAVISLGSHLPEPFMTLSFLALPVIGEARLTDMGLVDVNQFEIVPLFIES